MINRGRSMAPRCCQAPDNRYAVAGRRLIGVRHAGTIQIPCRNTITGKSRPASIHVLGYDLHFWERLA